jgi:hypothetical protein
MEELVATVKKHKKGGYDINLNVGEGHVVSLTDPSGVKGMNPDMRTTAKAQLKVLQDQMASLMQQLED